MLRILVLAALLCVFAATAAARAPRDDAASRTAMPILRITRDPACPGTISPLQYGQFVEYLCDLVPGMWAEKLYDGSFEGLTPYDFAYLKETDFREKPWYPTGAGNRADFVRDPSNPVGGRFAQKVAVEGGPPCTVGISQD